MKTNIFVPKIINVGYQNRKDTYTGKLAYVIYTDEKGVLRKQASWDSWRDSNIEPSTFNNVPLSGFVLNKKVGDTQTHWNFRQAYCRIYDPRGFEFEITIENLLYILENTNSIVGKGLEGDFVYGWDGKDLVLLPVNSPDYKEIQEFTHLMYSDQSISGKDLVVGCTYRGKDGCFYIYLGKYDEYSIPYPCTDMATNKGKHFWFARFKTLEELTSFMGTGKLNTYITTRKTLPAKFLLSVYDDTTFPYLSNFIDAMHKMRNFSPLDIENTEIIPFTQEQFVREVNSYMEKQTNPNIGWIPDIKFCNKPAPGELKHNYVLKVRREYSRESGTWGISEYCLFDYRSNQHPVTLESWKTLQEETIYDIYRTYSPHYLHLYLKNGEKYETVYEYPDLWT